MSITKTLVIVDNFSTGDTNEYPDIESAIDMGLDSFEFSIEGITIKRVKLTDTELIKNLVQCVDELLPGFGNTTANIGLINDTLIEARKYLKEEVDHERI